MVKFKDYASCQKASRLENEINYLEKNNADVDNLKENHKEFLKHIIFVLKSQQRFKSEARNVFTEEVNELY